MAAQSKDAPSESGGHGRWYSPEVFPLALEAVRAVVNQNLGAPIIGAGGIFSEENARLMLEAGAVAAQVDAALWQSAHLF